MTKDGYWIQTPSNIEYQLKIEKKKLYKKINKTKDKRWILDMGFLQYKGIN